MVGGREERIGTLARCHPVARGEVLRAGQPRTI